MYINGNIQSYIEVRYCFYCSICMTSVGTTELEDSSNSESSWTTCVAMRTYFLLTRLDMSKDIPEEISRLLGVSFTPIFPVYYSKPETGFVPHDPLQITDRQHRSRDRKGRTYSRRDQAMYPPILTLSSLTASTNSFKYSPKYFCLRSSSLCSAKESLDSSSTGKPFSVIQIGILQGLAYRSLM